MFKNYLKILNEFLKDSLNFFDSHQFFDKILQSYFIKNNGKNYSELIYVFEVSKKHKLISNLWKVLIFFNDRFMK